LSLNPAKLHLGESIPCSVTKSFYTTHEGQSAVGCEVTESTSPETDIRFVKVIWQGRLELPPGRPAQQEIKVTFSYDENQVMKCSFVDAATGRKTEIDISQSSGNSGETSEIDRFMVE
jgi:molecular chaperone DnaK (HSP70)